MTQKDTIQHETSGHDIDIPGAVRNEDYSDAKETQFPEQDDEYENLFNH